MAYDNIDLKKKLSNRKIDFEQLVPVCLYKNSSQTGNKEIHY